MSQSFAKRFFPNVDPIGRTFGDELNAVAKRWNQIVGVVSDAKYRSMREQAPPTYYELIDDELKWSDGVALYVRTRGDAGLVTGELRRMLAQMGKGIAPSETATMEQEIETSLWQERLIAALSAPFAALSAVLVAIGLYGMLGYSVARRTRELGMRVALGARVRHIASLIGRDTLWSIVPGLTLGRLCRVCPLLYCLEPFDCRGRGAAHDRGCDCGIRPYLSGCPNGTNRSASRRVSFGAGRQTQDAPRCSKAPRQAPENWNPGKRPFSRLNGSL